MQYNLVILFYIKFSGVLPILQCFLLYFENIFNHPDIRPGRKILYCILNENVSKQSIEI